MRILHVISTLESHGPARQLSLLSRRLASAGHETRVCTLGLRTFTAWWALRRVLRSWQPEIIHCWDGSALRAARLAGARTIVAEASPRRCGWLDRRFLRGASRIVARGHAEVGRCVTCGLPPDRIVRVPPAASSEVDRQMPAGLPPGRRIVCAGRLHPDKGAYDAIWAFDVLRFLHPDLHLILLGEGPDRLRLHGLVRGLGSTERVHFFGHRDDAALLIAQADVVWIPDRVDGGVNVTLEAMAAGRPVVASQLPALAEIVVAGETGFLVPVGDKVARARHTRLLLDDPALAQRLGAASRIRAQQQYSLEGMVRGYMRLYAELGLIVGHVFNVPGIRGTLETCPTENL